MVTIIAEVGSCHDGSLGNALRMVELWAAMGADIVKFQDHRWQHPKAGLHPSRHVHEPRGEYYKRTEFTSGRWDRIRDACDLYGVDLMVSCFSVEAVEDQGQRCAALKVASGEVTNLPLLEAMANTGLPVYLSWGMATHEEYTAAANVLGDSCVCYMHCTSAYPCPPERVGLNMVGHFGGFEGFSDHTMGMAASLAAITLGATVIERHVTPSRHLYGSDAAHSLEPEEFARFVAEVRDLEAMLAHPVDKDQLAATPEMQAMRKTFMGAK